MPLAFVICYHMEWGLIRKVFEAETYRWICRCIGVSNFYLALFLLCRILYSDNLRIYMVAA